MPSRQTRVSGTAAGTLLVLISAAGFGALAILAKAAYAAGVAPSLALNWRFIIAAVLMAGYVRLNGLSFRVRRREALVLLLLGGIGYATMSSLFFASLRYIPASATSLLLYTYPAFVCLLSYLVWRTPLGRRRLLALILAGAGTALLLWSPDLRLNPAGTALGLSAAFVYSFYLLANQALSPAVEPAVASAYIITGAALTFTALNAAQGALTATLPIRAWLALILMAVFSTSVAIGTLLAGIRRLGAATASILSTFEPVVTILLAVVFLDERLTVSQAAGGALIGAGVILLHLPGGQRTAAPHRPAAGG